ncbi:MAG: KAP family NTPase [Planctomycetota bacterium]|nr:KAP family NTPase [Planctomycetota bacterium]
MSSRGRAKKHNLWSDVPIEDPRDDELGRARFAETVAKSIRAMKGSESFVFGICGPWGCGKSSVLQMIGCELKKGKAENRPVVVDFNPWWFSGHEQLLTSFLAQLSSVLGRSDVATGTSKIAANLNTLAKVLTPISWFSKTAKEAKEVVAASAEAAQAFSAQLTLDIHGLRKAIGDELRASKRRIVIVMDDIDRLTASEIAQLFMIVKAVADFPNTVYLLAFDHGVVCNAIQTQLGQDGASYLEKIVQIQIAVPPAGPISLHRMFYSQINSLIPTEENIDIIKKEFWNLFYDGLSSFFTTPRSVKRLTNVLRVLYPSIAGEVHWPDFFAMTALQVFAPETHAVIRDNYGRFTGYDPHHRHDIDRSETKRFHESWVAQIPEHRRDAVVGLVKRLFPRVDSALRGGSYGSGGESRATADLRVRSPECVDRYLQYAVPTGAISEAEWRLFLSEIASAEVTDSQIRKWCTQSGPNKLASRGKVFLDKLLVFANNQATDSQAEMLLRVVLRNGDHLIFTEDCERIEILEIDNKWRLNWAVRALLARIPEGMRRENALEESSKSAELVTLTEVVRSLGIEHGLFGTNDRDRQTTPLVREEVARSLARFAAQRLAAAASAGTLAQHPQSLLLVQGWRVFSETDDAQNWLNDASRNDETLARFLVSAQSKTWSHSGNDNVATEGLSAGAEFLLTWWNGTELRDRCKSILKDKPNWLTEDYESALKLVIRSMSKDGKALDSFHHRRKKPDDLDEEDDTPDIADL